MRGSFYVKLNSVEPVAIQYDENGLGKKKLVTKQPVLIYSKIIEMIDALIFWIVLMAEEFHI